MNCPNKPFHRHYSGLSATVVVICLLALGCSSTKQTAFPSPDKAAEKLVVAMRANDTDALRRIFGPEAELVLYSGDPVADKHRFDKFLAAYDEAHYLKMDVHGAVTLVVGKKDWPLPIPLTFEERGWVFDTETGWEEILNRRIGQNELEVIEVCRALVDAQKEYAMMDPDGDGIAEYAQKIASEPGKKDGLYWQSASGEPQSPMGQFVADAVAEGYSSARNTTGAPRPYHGYCYRLLKSQGPKAKGGALDYVVNGRMIGGFAVVAYPAEYGISGIMTFMVNHQGTVYQQDLGEETGQVARAMESFDPGSGWEAVPSLSTVPAVSAK